MQTVLALSPLLVLVAAMAALGWSAWRAALAALLLVAVLSALRAHPSPAGVWVHALPDALLLAGIVVYTLLFGLLLYHLMERSGAQRLLLERVRGLGRDGVESLAWVLLVFGPLFESITGFGLGAAMVFPMLLALGYGAFAAMGLALLSQVAVPWGALAIGMNLGAAMAGLPLERVGTAAAIVAAPACLAFWVATLALARPPAARRPLSLLRGAGAVAVFAGGVWFANRWISAELGGVVGPLVLAGWLSLTGGGPRRNAIAAALRDGIGPLVRAGAPIAVLVVLLALTRYVDALRGWLSTHAVLHLPGGSFALPLLYNPGAVLALACLTAVVVQRLARPEVSAAVRATLRQWWNAARAVFLLLLVARLMAEAGYTAMLGDAGGRLPPVLAAVAIPLLGGLGGLLTGSVAGSNALFMDLDVALAARLGFPLLWVAAVQNVVSAGFTALSPARIVFVAALADRPDAEGAVLRRLLPLGLALALVGALALWPWGRALLESIRPWLVGG